MSNVFEEKNIAKAIIRLGIPAMLAQLATLIYNTADTYFVSLTKSPDQIAAVTLCAPVLLIIMSIATVFGMGGGSVIARLLGEGKTHDSRICFSFCAWATVIAGIIVTILGLIFINPIAEVIGTDSNNFSYTCDYLRIIFIGSPFIMLSSQYGHSFRSVALINQATIGVIVGNIINIILDWIFIVPLGMGTTGAALATVIGYAVSSAYYILCIVNAEKKGNDTVAVAPIRIQGNLVLNTIKIGIPGALITVMLSVSNIVLNSHIALYGSDAVACYGIAYRIDMFPVLLSVGLSQGIAPLMGYCYGAKQYKRLSKSISTGLLFNMILVFVFIANFFLFSRPLVSIFLDNEALIEQAARFLLIVCLSGPFFSVINMITSYFQALGKAAHSLVITLLRNLILFIPSVIILNAIWKLNGVIATTPAVEAAVAILCVVLYINDKKKLNKVMSPDT